MKKLVTCLLVFSLALLMASCFGLGACSEIPQKTTGQEQVSNQTTISGSTNNNEAKTDLHHNAFIDPGHKGHNSEKIVWGISVPGFPDVADWLYDFETKLNACLKEKQAAYTVDVVIYYDSNDLNAEGDIKASEKSPVLKLKDLKEQDIQLDVISIPAVLSNDFSSTTKSYYHEAVEAGLLYNLSEFLETKAGKNTLQGLTPELVPLYKLKSGIYGLFNQDIYLSAVSYNLDLLAELGLKKEELKADLFQNETVFRRVKDKTKAMPLVGGFPSSERYFNLSLVRGQCGLGRDLEGNFISALENQNFIDLYTYLTDFKVEGLFTDDMSFLSSPTKSYFAYMGGSRDTEPFLSDGFYVVPNPDLMVSGPQSSNFPALSLSSWTRNQEYALDFLEKLFADRELANLIKFGIEGKDFDLEEGHAIRRHDANKVWLSFLNLNAGNSLLTYPEADESLNKKELASWKAKNFFQTDLAGFVFDISPVQKEMQRCSVFLDGGMGEDYFDPVNQKVLNFKAENQQEALENLAALDQIYKERGLYKIIAELNRQFAKYQEQAR